MDELICEKLKKLKPYSPSIDKCKIHLDANESCIEFTNEMKKKIAQKVLTISFNRYPDPLATASCELFGNRIGIPSRLITAGNGSDELLTTLFGVFTQRGDKVLLTEPDFSMYEIYARSYECEAIVLHKDESLSFNIDEMIEKANTNHVRFILFSNPCNPTGQGISRENVLRIVRESHCLVIVDEAYMDFWNQSVLTEAPAAENLIVLKTCSKIGFAAGRLGFAVANTYITDYLRAAKSPYNVNALTQAAAEVFLSEQKYIDDVADAIKRSRDRLYAALKSLEEKYTSLMRVYPSHTNFVLVKIEDAPSVLKALLSFGISVRLMGNYLRITAGLETENRELLKTLENILSNM